MFLKRREKPAKPTMARLRISKPESLTSSSTISTTPTSSSASSRRSRTVEYDPLGLHPTHHAPPPRLADRAFIDVGAGEPSSAGYLEAAAPKVEDPGYFKLRLDMLQRPTLVRSHWSESTIGTLSDSSESDGSVEGLESVDTEGEEEEEEVVTPTAHEGFFEEEEVREPAWTNFSYKRNTVAVVPRRRPGAGNAVDDYVKRGGWKRRGIVFQNKDDDYAECLSARTVG